MFISHLNKLVAVPLLLALKKLITFRKCLKCPSFLCFFQITEGRKACGPCWTTARRFRTATWPAPSRRTPTWPSSPCSRRESWNTSSRRIVMDFISEVEYPGTESSGGHSFIFFIFILALHYSPTPYGHQCTLRKSFSNSLLSSHFISVTAVRENWYFVKATVIGPTRQLNVC